MSHKVWKVSIGVTLTACLSMAGCASDPNARLIEAVKNWEVEEARVALKAGADPNLITSELDGNQTPILVFAIGNRPSLAPVLMEQGADVNRVGTSGEAPLVAALANRQAPKSLIYTILKRQPNLNTPSHRGVLLVSSRRELEEVDLILLRRGADFRLRDNDGRDALFYAASVGKPRTVSALFKKG